MSNTIPCKAPDYSNSVRCPENPVFMVWGLPGAPLRHKLHLDPAIVQTLPCFVDYELIPS